MSAEKPLFSDTLGLSGLGCQRGGRVLFRGVSLQCGAGGLVVLAGANGAGKSSLLRILSGALPAGEGRVTWNGVDIPENDRAAQSRRTAFLPADDRDLKALETVGETMAFWAGLYGVDAAARAAALRDTGIAGLAAVPVRRLSAGQRRRLSIARVLMRADAPLWLLDEPFNGLDDAAVALVRVALAQHRARGGIVVMAAHHAPVPEGAIVLALDEFSTAGAA